MDQENQISININSADEESLTKLHGVGTRLAKQIIDERPYTTIDDLTRVTGISEKDVERLRPNLSISDSPEQPEALEDIDDVEVPQELDGTELEALEISTETVAVIESAAEDQEPPIDELEDADESQETGEPDDLEENDEAILEGDTPEELEDSAAEDQEAELIEEVDQDQIVEQFEPVEETPVKEPVAQPGYITRGGACSLVLVGALLTLILAVAITLGIISSINQGQLNYASPSQIAALQSQNETLSTQSYALAEDIDSLRTRMDNLESLSSQVGEIETEISAMQEEIDQLQTELAANQAADEELALRLDAIEEELHTLSDQSDRFENFLEGMRTLMEGLFPQEPEVEETP